MPERDVRPGTTITNKAADRVLNADTRPDDDILEQDLTEQMVRRPTEADFEEVLTPEGNTGDLFVGPDVSDSTMASDSSVGGTG